VTSLMVLSHLGIDIAPLLAGAGVVGLAIGFGSQALVKDIITGLFILLEDQIAVGDIVDVGKDHKGVVEAITIRTIRLRDLSGTVHTVPFSEVTSVKNLSKDFSYAIARITISYREDIDRVVEILRAVGDQLAQDETVQSLHRRGESMRAMRARLAAKGMSAADIADAVSDLRAAAPDPDLAAACVFARRRRLGPFRRATADHMRELGAFARAGFSRRVAEAVLACANISAVEVLARGERE